MNPATVILAAMLVVAAECTNGSATSNPGFSNLSTGAIGWSAEGDGDLTPGVDDAQILYLDDFVVFWSDFPPATATSIAYGSDGDHLGGGGQFINADIGEIEFRYEITDRSSGTVAIGSETFELSGGGLFLIAARKLPVKVQQVEYDLSEVKKTEKGLRLLPNSEPAIAEFFRKSSGHP